VKGTGLINNRLVYVLPLLVGVFNILIMKNFFQSIPESLAESARIDGANDFSILFRIYLPLSKPILATVGLWTAVFHWNSWFDGLLYVTNNDKQVLQVLLQRIVIENSTEMIAEGIIDPDLLSFTPETIKAATVIITILPILLLYPFVQKYVVKGIMIGGVKE
jgi:putative aldouronate transport system permease protein